MIILNIGLFDKDTKEQKITTDEATKILADYFDCTIIPCYGVYTHDNGTKIIEPSIKVEIYNNRYSEVYWIVKRELLNKFNQESIIISCINETDTKFVTRVN